jgi:hypothetical protein
LETPAEGIEGWASYEVGRCNVIAIQMKRRMSDSIQDSSESFYRRSLEIDFTIEAMSLRMM